MAAFIVDPAKMYAEGAVVDWVLLVRRLGITNINIQALVPAIQLRWMLSGDMGLPTEPFQVWSRPHLAQGVVQTLSIAQQQLLFLFNFNAVTWPNGSMCSVNVDIQAPSGGTIAAFVGSPSLENFITLQTIPNGSTTVTPAAPVIDGLLVSSGVTVTAVHGVATNALSQAAGWTPIETVGLPVKKADWATISRQGDPQGMAGVLVDAPTAAQQRLKRGAPPVGWEPLLAAGVPAPTWTAPNFGGLVGEVNVDLLVRLRTIAAAFPPGQQAAQVQTIPIPAPQNSSGNRVTANSSDAKVAPLAMLLMAASSDPFLSLTLGFGTAYVLPDSDLAVGRRALDYMITAHWEKGLDGNSAPLDYAAIVSAPSPALAPPPPANMIAQTLGVLKPLQPDGNWRGSERIAWDRPLKSPLFRTASFAAARVGITPPEPPAALMTPRTSGGLSPIVINSPDIKSPTTPDPEAWRLNFIDRELPIPANPGNRTMTYGAAVQDIYGQWTPWVSIAGAMTQPDLDQVRLANAKLIPTPPAAGTICPATLEIEFLWDWSVRTPQRIRFAGRLYGAAEHGSPPPPGLPVGFDRSLASGGAFLDVTFAGDTPSAPGATLIGLDGSGETQVAFGPPQGAESRRYRMTVTGFALDFSAAGHIGLAIWAMAQERIAPQRVSALSEHPLIISTSDPRPPVVPVEHVALTSLPDAAGEAHARIAWTLQPNATGYYIYESDETQILRALNLHEPTPDQTLDDRLKIIKDNFSAIPRRAFTRLNSTALSGPGKDISLPRGSTAIHTYIVIGISAGQVESDWPTDPNALIAVAVPHIMVPAPPMLEAQRFLDTMTSPPTFKARISIATRPVRAFRKSTSTAFAWTMPPKNWIPWGRPPRGSKTAEAAGQ